MSKCKCFYSINLHFEEIIPIELKNESTIPEFLLLLRALIKLLALY